MLSAIIAKIGLTVPMAKVRKFGILLGLKRNEKRATFDNPIAKENEFNEHFSKVGE